MRRHLPGLAAGTVLLALTAGCSSDDATRPVWATALSPGDCIDFDPAGLTAIERVDLVPCALPHDMEVFGLAPYASPARAPQNAGSDAAWVESVDEYPGEEKVQAAAAEKCSGSFRTYLAGTRPQDGTIPQQAYELTYLYPSAQAWTASGKTRAEAGPLGRLVNRLIDRPPAPEQQVTCLVRRSLPEDEKNPQCRRQLDGTVTPADPPPAACAPQEGELLSRAGRLTS